MSSQKNPPFAVGDHEVFMELAIHEAQKSPPFPEKFCVGAVLVDADTGTVLSTGYSCEFPRDYGAFPGPTHPEQCCIIKIAERENVPENRIHEVLPENTALYTTMEPCNMRTSGYIPCVTRIITHRSAIKTVYVGIREPGTFVAQNDGQKRLEEKGVKVVFPVEHWRERILKVSLAGHESQAGSEV